MTTPAAKVRYTIATPKPRGIRALRERPHERVQEQRDEGRHEEEEDGVTDRAGDRPGQQEHEREGDQLDPARNLDRGGLAAPTDDRRRRFRHESDRTARSRRPQGPVWDWSFAEDGNLALDRHDLWEEIPSTPRLRLLQSPAVAHSLRQPQVSVTVPAMPQSPGPARRARRAQRRSAHRLRRFAGLTAVAAVGVVTLLVTAFGPDGAESVARSAPAPADRLLPSGPPEPLVVATQGALRVQLPIEQNRVTAIGYHGGVVGLARVAPARPTRQPGPDRTVLRPRLRRRRLEHDLVPAPGRHRFVDVGARGRRGAGHRRLLAGRRNDRGDHRLRPQRPDAGQANRHPTTRRARTHRLDHAARSRPCADRRLVRRGGEKPARRGARPLAARAAGARALHAGRREPRDRPGLSGHSARTAHKTSLRRRRRRSAGTDGARDAPGESPRGARRRPLRRERRERRRRRRA